MPMPIRTTQSSHQNTAERPAKKQGREIMNNAGRDIMAAALPIKTPVTMTAPDEKETTLKSSVKTAIKNEESVPQVQLL